MSYVQLHLYNCSLNSCNVCICTFSDGLNCCSILVGGPLIFVLRGIRKLACRFLVAVDSGLSHRSITVLTAANHLCAVVHLSADAAVWPSVGRWPVRRPVQLQSLLPLHRRSVVRVRMSGRHVLVTARWTLRLVSTS